MQIFSLFGRLIKSFTFTGLKARECGIRSQEFTFAFPLFTCGPSNPLNSVKPKTFLKS